MSLQDPSICGSVTYNAIFGTARGHFPPILTKSSPIQTVQSDEHIVEKVLSYRKRERGFYFLAIMKGELFDGAAWKPTRNFVHQNNAVTEILQEYLHKKNTLPLHAFPYLIVFNAPWDRISWSLTCISPKLC